MGRRPTRMRTVTYEHYHARRFYCRDTHDGRLCSAGCPELAAQGDKGHLAIHARALRNRCLSLARVRGLDKCSPHHRGKWHLACPDPRPARDQASVPVTVTEPPVAEGPGRVPKGRQG